MLSLKEKVHCSFLDEAERIDKYIIQSLLLNKTKKIQ